MIAPDQAARMAQNFDGDAEPDLIGEFLADCCEVSGSHAVFTRSRELVDGFNFWLRERDGGEWRERTISMRIKERSKSFRHPRTGQGFQPHCGDVAGYLGIELTYPFLRRFRPAPKVEQDSESQLGLDPGTAFCAFVFLGMIISAGLLITAVSL